MSSRRGGRPEKGTTLLRSVLEIRGAFFFFVVLLVYNLKIYILKNSFKIINHISYV